MGSQVDSFENRDGKGPDGPRDLYEESLQRRKQLLEKVHAGLRNFLRARSS